MIHISSFDHFPKFQVHISNCLVNISTHMSDKINISKENLFTSVSALPHIPLLQFLHISYFQCHSFKSQSPKHIIFIFFLSFTFMFSPLGTVLPLLLRICPESDHFSSHLHHNHVSPKNHHLSAGRCHFICPPCIHSCLSIDSLFQTETRVVF